MSRGGHYTPQPWLTAPLMFLGLLFVVLPIALVVEDAAWALYGFGLLWAFVIGLLARRWYRVTVVERGVGYRVVRAQSLRGATTAKAAPVIGRVDVFMDEYIRRYSERDLEGVTELCLAPFLAIREGVPIRMPDRDTVRAHFGAMIDAYSGGGVAIWKRVESDTRQLGEHAVFTTVRWNALDSEGKVLRDTRTTYHLLATPEGWRFLSYTNHF